MTIITLTNKHIFFLHTLRSLYSRHTSGTNLPFLLHVHPRTQASQLPSRTETKSYRQRAHVELLCIFHSHALPRWRFRKGRHKATSITNWPYIPTYSYWPRHLRPADDCVTHSAHAHRDTLIVRRARRLCAHIASRACIEKDYSTMRATIVGPYVCAWLAYAWPYADAGVRGLRGRRGRVSSVCACRRRIGNMCEWYSLVVQFGINTNGYGLPRNQSKLALHYVYKYSAPHVWVHPSIHLGHVREYLSSLQSFHNVFA